MAYQGSKGANTMLSNFFKPRLVQFWRAYRLAFFLILIGSAPGLAHAQTEGLQPQKVIATSSFACGNTSLPATLEVWNVGAQGGQAYAQATITGYNCINDKPDMTLRTMTGTFTGGPNGVATFEICTGAGSSSQCVTLAYQFVDGKRILFNGVESGYVIQNPEAFGAAGSDCTAAIHYDPAIKPGDTLSPWATYTAVPGGQPVTPIGEAFLINGKLTPSAVWDGGETTIELQYTCPGHQGHVATLTLPAAGSPTLTPTEALTLTPAGSSTPQATDTPEPSETPTTEGTAASAVTATKSSCKNLSANAQLSQVLQRYYSQIPKGIADSGNKNNLLTLWDDQYNEYVCGSYQAKILRLLDEIKFHPDPCVRALLDDWDYGPIEAFWGGHQAVVIYPRGATWTESGLVLDPWITQSPQVYAIEEWSIHFSGSSQYGVRGSSEYENQPRYPTVGGTYIPTGELKLSAEENAFIRTLPPAKQEWLKKMSEVSRKAWLGQMLRRQKQNATLSVNSPLDVYLINEAGQAAGFMQGTLVDDLSEVHFRRFKRADGEYWTEVDYPAERNYRVVMVGTASGPARVFSVQTSPTGAGAVYQYDFAVSPGESYQSETSAIGSPLVSSQARIQPAAAKMANLEWILSQAGLAEPPRYEPGAALSLNQGIMLACGAGACVISALVLLLGVVWFARRSR
jgi:hypothetical protein